MTTAPTRRRRGLRSPPTTDRALPVGAGDVRYFIEAEDTRGNVAQGTLERVFLA